MVREILKLRTDMGLGNNDPLFHNIEITEYSYSSTRMGMPQMTATLMWPKCLDNEWTGKEYVTFRGERYYIRHTPSSSKNNTDTRYQHDLIFVSERDELLGNVYFIDAVYSCAATYDKPCSNSTTVIFYGTLREFCDRLNCALRYAGVGDSILSTKTALTTLDEPIGDGYCVMLDPYGDYDKDVSKEFSFSDQYLWDVISQGYESFEVPFEMRGKRIIFGAVPQKIDRIFKYGCDNELLSVKKNNANAKVINRITMLGSSENIPYFYPNETEYGHVNLMVDPDNKVLSDTSVIEIANISQLVSNLREGSFAELKAYKEESSALVNVSNTMRYSFDQITWKDFQIGTAIKHPNEGRKNKTIPVYFQLKFNVSMSSEFRLGSMTGNIWEQNSAMPALPQSLLSGVTPVSLKTVGGVTELVNNVKISENGIDFGYLDYGEWAFIFSISVKNASDGLFSPITSYIGIMSVSIYDTIVTERSGFYWEVDGKRMRTGELGLKLPIEITNKMVGDKVGWFASDRINTQKKLMPPKYRETKGAQRFYNAVNGIYADPDTNKMYIFPNPFVEGAPNEYIYKNEDIKPTLEGLRNADNLLMGEIADIAYDSDDNDSLKSESSEDTDKNDSLKYAHSYFYIRLNIFNGTYGFNLFNHASQTDPMIIQMTSGSCDGCKFKVQAVEFTDDSGMNFYKNPIQVNPQTGDIVPGTYNDKVKKDKFDETQQDSSVKSIWLCIQKDAETFGVIMPNNEHNYRPKKGDTFNIINIDLPEVYIKAAEKRLEEEGLRFMLDNNEEKFTFDISASRIFFANNPKVLAQLDEYSLIAVEYNGKTYEQYVSAFNVNCKDSEALPDIQVNLTDTLAVGESFVQNVAERALSMIANPETMGSGTGGTPTRLLDKRYMRKDQDDRTPHKIASSLGFEVGRYTSGSSGGIFYQDPETGRVYLEVDELRVRMKAIFEELMISKVTSIAGKQVITPGGSIDITYVEDIAADPATGSKGAYRCYYKAKEDDKGGKCMFVVGDQVQCREFNVSTGTTTNASNRFYWRKVVAVSEEGSYVDLSKNDCAPNSDVPQIGDTVCQLGSREDKTRRSAIVFSTVDEFAPCITLYNGIGEGTKIAEWYSMDAKSVIEYGVDKTKNPPEPFFNCYGRMYVGPRTRESYIEFTPSNKKIVFKGELDVKSTISGKDLLSFIQENAGVSEDIEDFINNALKGFQDQIDGVIETWFFNGVPTLTNYPASGWNTDALKIQHLGDLYYDNDTGTAYRFSQKTDKSYYWNVITDDAITKALAAAAAAQDTADSKRRVFTAQPQTKDVYDPGDLWVNATYGTLYSNDILRCITHKDAGTPFNIDHWILASKYTDDAGLNEFIKRYEKEIAGYKTQLDGKIDTWYFNYNPTVSNKPASDWNDTEKTEHAGDLFYNTATKKVFRWTGTAWESMTDPDIQAALDSAADAQDTADNKRRVFMSQPTTPYDEGDLWINNGTNGKTLKVCVKSRGSGNFLASEWVVADDAALNVFADTVEKSLNGIQDQLDKKAQTWYQANDPSVAWNTAELKAEHKGDLWYNTTNGTTWYWNGTSWQQQNVPDSVFDAIDGKADIFVSKPTNGYLMNDLWFLESKYTLSGVEYDTGTLVVAIRDMGSAWSANDWIKKDRYTDDTLAQEAVDRFIKWADDGVFSPTEMKELELEIGRIDGDKSKFDQQYAVYDSPGSALTSAKTAYDSAYTVYKASINSVLNATPDKDGCVSVPSDFQSKMQHYYNVRAQYDYNFTLKQKEYSDSVVAQYEYLKNALAQDTSISGGLIISTLASMGYTDSNGIRHTLAGINGQRASALGDRSIASWWGGQMLDLFDKNDNRVTPKPANAATALVRMDGSAYFANGNIGFRADGSGWLGNDTTGIKFSNTGVMTFGSGVTFNVTNVLGLKDSLDSLANFNAGLTNLLRPCDANGNEISWEEGGQLDADGTYKAKSLKAKVGFWSDFFISARGKNPNEGGGVAGATALSGLTDVALTNPVSGQALVYNGSKWVNRVIQTGLDTAQLASYLTTNNYAKKSDIPSLTNYVTTNTAQTISALKTMTKGLKVSGRVVGSGDDEGINIGLAANGFAGLCLGNNAGKRSVFYFVDTSSELKAFWRFYNGATIFDIHHPSKSGTIALTSDIPSLAGYVTLDTPQVITGAKTFESYIFLRGKASKKGLYLTSDDSTGDVIFPQHENNTYKGEAFRFYYDGSFLANSIKKRGGTSSQFLKADGSVDSNTYLRHTALNGGLIPCSATTWGNSTGTQVAEWTDSAGNCAFKFKKDNPSSGKMSMLIDGTVYINEGADAVASQSWVNGAYVKKTGDTMTGALKVNEITNQASTYTMLGYGLALSGYAANTIWSVGSLDLHGVIRSSNSSLVHYRNGIGAFTIWDSGNDGSGSGLDADLLDGVHNGSVTANRLNFYNRWESSTSDTSNLAIIKQHYTELPVEQPCAVGLRHGTISMAFGWRLGGTYNSVDKAYCGWFISDYGTPRWIGADNGTWKSETFAFISSTVANANSLGGVAAANYARQAYDNNFITAGNEFNFVPNAYSGDVHFNYKTSGGSPNGSIKKYLFRDGAKGFAPVQAASFIRNGGTASQFLKADGSVDGTSYLSRAGGSMANTNVVTNLNADMLDGEHLDSVRGYRVNHPSINTALSVGYMPFNAFGMQHGTPLYNDPEFTSGNNSVNVYNNANNGNVVITRIADSQASANSSGYILQITVKGAASPGLGGFYQNISSRANAVFMQIFRAKIPMGYRVNRNSNTMGNGYSDVWITSQEGTGKWEWYGRITYCGASGTFSNGGHVSLSGTTPTASAPLYWYLSHCQVWDLTKNNYGAFRAKFADGLSTARTINGTSFNGTANIVTSYWGTTRTLWGQNCNGSANVSGNMSGVGDINTTAANGRKIVCNGASHSWGLLSGSGGENRGIYEFTSGINKWLLYFDNTHTHINHGALVAHAGISSTSIKIELDANGSATGMGGEINRYGAPLYLQHRGNASNPTGNILMCYNGGYVGIGTTSPNRKLHVNGDIQTSSIYASNWLRTTGNTGWYSQTYGGGWYMSDSTWIRSYGSKSIYVNTGQIRCDGYFNRQAYTGTSWNAGYGAYNVEIADNREQTPLMVAYRAGQSATATGSNRLFALELLNSGTILRFCFGGAYKFQMSNGGEFYASAGIYSDGYVSARGRNTSDIRLKQDIAPFRATDIIKALRPVRFKWNGTARSKFSALDTAEVQYGLIAQEAIKVTPTLVKPHMFGDEYMGIRYEGYIPILMQAQKETIFDVEDLKARVTRLESENRELKSQISKLKTQLT